MDSGKKAYTEGKNASVLEAKKSQKWTNLQNKTLLEWVQILAGIAVPFVIFFASQAIQARSEAIADAERRQEILSSYLEDINELLLDKKLRHPEIDSEVQVVARINTLNVTRRLDHDGESKGRLIEFLYEANLIGKCQTRGLGECGNRLNTVLLLRDARLDRAIVPPTALFAGIDLSEARLYKATFTGIDLTNAQLQNVVLEAANLNKAILSDANLQLATLTNAHLLDAQMYRADLRGARLENANLSNAILEDAILTNAFLKGAKLDHAYLQNADLRGANLEGASLQGTDLKGAKYDSKTQFPRDFDPHEKEMALIP